jgi:arsenite methyltransferase
MSRLPPVPDAPPDLAAHNARLVTERHVRVGRALLEQLLPPRGAAALELGCGTGLLTEHLARCIGPRGDVLGLDASAYHVTIAHQRGGPGLRFQVGSAQDLSRFPAGCFDVVVANDLLADWPDPLGRLRELARVLKPAGRLGLVTRSAEHPHPVEAALVRLLARPPYAAWPCPPALQRHEVSAAGLANLLAQSGFGTVRIEAQAEPLVHASVSAAMAFVEATHWGRWLTHLPEACPAGSAGEAVLNLRAQARAELATELLRLRSAQGLRHEGVCLLAVASVAG